LNREKRIPFDDASVNTQNRPSMDTSKPATTSRSD
jgi:hypothetical protein